MAKKVTEKKETEILDVQDFTQIEDTTKQEVDLEVISDVKLKRGEILVVEIDDEGKEGKEFVTNQITFEKYFNNGKFKIKKK